MGKIKTFKYLWRNNKRGIIVALYNKVVHLGITNILSDQLYLKLTYRIKIGGHLDLLNPQTFNQKLQWLKLYDRKPEYTKMVDKALVKQYVADLIGEEYIIPTLGIWHDFEMIDFNALPERFVLKCTHDSGSVVVCENRNNLNWKAARRKLRKGLRTDAFLWGREWPYKNVIPQIIAEENIDIGSEELVDYKFMCFNGRVKCSFVCTDRFSESGLKVTFFDRDWNVMPFERHYPKSKKEIKKPKSYEKMIKLAEILSKDIPFVRVDFYDVDGKVYFGELTFFPGSGFEEFMPVEWDYRLGEWLDLPERCER